MNLTESTLQQLYDEALVARMQCAASWWPEFVEREAAQLRQTVENSPNPPDAVSFYLWRSATDRHLLHTEPLDLTPRGLQIADLRLADLHARQMRRALDLADIDELLAEVDFGDRLLCVHADGYGGGTLSYREPCGFRTWLDLSDTVPGSGYYPRIDDALSAFTAAAREFRPDLYDETES